MNFLLIVNVQFSKEYKNPKLVTKNPKSYKFNGPKYKNDVTNL